MKTLPSLFAILALMILPAALGAEISGSQPVKKLSKFEASLVGNWYFAGDRSKPCYFASSGAALFSINEEKTSLDMRTTKGGFLVGSRPGYVVTCKLQGDYLLWSNGWWWSRKPVEWPSARRFRSDEIGRLQAMEDSKARERSEGKLTKFESSLVGKWYFAGAPHQVVRVLSVDGKMFHLNENLIGIELRSAGGNFLTGTRPDATFDCLVEEETLLFNNGVWDSRKPIEWSPRSSVEDMALQ
jgi:hypothetical protein